MEQFDWLEFTTMQGTCTTISLSITFCSMLQGLRELYDFKKANPNADLSVFMMGVSKFYQGYIERGLKSVEAEVSTGGAQEGTH